jgi:branched-chain amino acid aminotransferase
MMAGKNPEQVWMNGELVPWEKATIHVRTDAFLYGASVFEGLRAYPTPDKQQLYIFKNDEHMDRLVNSSAKILRMQCKWTAEDITRGMIEMLRANNFRGDTHIRPTIYFGAGEAYSFDPDKIEVGCVVVAVERPSTPMLQTGATARVTSWRRITDEAMPPRVKASANYLNSRYALMDAKIDGYDTAILLGPQGKVAEGPGACLMMVRGGRVITPPVTAGILESITRDTLMQLFREEMGVEVVEREMDRTELYIADEVFLCGTAWEVMPIVSVDRYPVGTGQVGPMVKQVQELFFGIARGQNPKYMDWLTPVY